MNFPIKDLLNLYPAEVYIILIAIPFSLNGKIVIENNDIVDKPFFYGPVVSIFVTNFSVTAIRIRINYGSVYLKFDNSQHLT